MTYNFDSDDERRGLFAEVCSRAFITALRDWPNMKTGIQCFIAAFGTGALLRAEVCCIADRDPQFYTLIGTAWLWAYGLVADGTMPEESFAPFLPHVKDTPISDMLAWLRPAFTQPPLREALEAAYAEYLRVASELAM
jgi:hypothetical protein